jgi:hypothetical protein
MASNEAMTLKVNGAAATSLPASVLLNRHVRQGTILECPVQVDGGAVA